VSIQLDRSRQRKLIEAMPTHSRASVVFSSCDSLSRAFLSCPAYDGGMTSAVFSESFARYLAAPSPACIPHVGRTLYASGRRDAVDAHGDDLVAAATTGGMEAKYRHDVLRDMLTTSIRGAGGSATAENSMWIHAAIPSAALAAMAARAGTPQQVRPMVPDVTYIIDPADGEQVAECKTIAYCPTYYALGRSGVNVRARQVQAEYLRKARAQDRAFGLAQLAPGSSVSGPNSTIGPIERQLNSVAPIRVAVVGGFGEGSEDLHGLIGEIARKAALTAHVRLGLEQHPAAAHPEAGHCVRAEPLPPPPCPPAVCRAARRATLRLSRGARAGDLVPPARGGRGALAWRARARIEPPWGQGGLNCSRPACGACA
jgi:hypothetical protein